MDLPVKNSKKKQKAVAFIYLATGALIGLSGLYRFLKNNFDTQLINGTHLFLGLMFLLFGISRLIQSRAGKTPDQTNL